MSFPVCLSLSRCLVLKAMLALLSEQELVKLCQCPIEVIQDAAEGGELDILDFDSLCDAIEAWDAGKESKRGEA